MLTEANLQRARNLAERIESGEIKAMPAPMYSSLVRDLLAEVERLRAALAHLADEANWDLQTHANDFYFTWDEWRGEGDSAREYAAGVLTRPATP